MRKAPFITFLLILMFFGCAPRATISHREIKRINFRIEGILKNPILKPATIGIFAVTEKGETIIDYNSEKLMLPASNMKLLLSAALLYYLGPSFSLKTILLRDSIGNVYLRGGGDPSLETGDLLKIALNFSKYAFKPGTLFVCEDYLDTIRFQPGWTFNEVGSFYAPPLGGLSVNRNLLRVLIEPGEKEGALAKVRTIPDDIGYPKFVVKAKTISHDTFSIKVSPMGKDIYKIEGFVPEGEKSHEISVGMREPALFTGNIFNWCLRKLGIPIAGPILKRCAPADADTLLVYLSPPLSTILKKMNKMSDNFLAEMLLKDLGAQVYGSPGTREKGISALMLYLSNIGIDTLSLRPIEGSGLSRYNLLSPAQIVKVLLDATSRWGTSPEFLSSLPISGIDGTLQERLATLRNRVRAKTGTLWGVSSLSGVGIDGKGRKIIFSILINNYIGRNNGVRELEDKMVDILLNK